MRAGTLRHSVEIQRASETREADGGITPKWRTIAHRYASIEPLKGREFWSAQQVNSAVTHKIKLRFLAGLLATDRIRMVHGGRIFNIAPPLDVMERRREMVIMASEAVSEAA